MTLRRECFAVPVCTVNQRAGGVPEIEVPKPNLQAPGKQQTLNTNQFFARAMFGTLSLEFLWLLDPGPWDFGTRAALAQGR